MSTFCSHHASALSRHSSSSIIIRPRNFGFGNYKLPVLSESSPVYSKMMKHVADGCQIETLERQLLIRVRRRLPHD